MMTLARWFPRFGLRCWKCFLLLGGLLAAACPALAGAPPGAAPGSLVPASVAPGSSPDAAEVATATARDAAVPVASAGVLAAAEARTAGHVAEVERAASCPHDAPQRGAQAPRYAVQPLELVSVYGAMPNAINNRGWVVGYTEVASGVMPTLWIDGRAYDLGGPGSVGIAYDINDAGRIVGVSYGGETPWRAVTWYRGQVRILPNLTRDPAFDAAARGINRSGLIVGQSDIRSPGNDVVAATWRQGVPRRLARLGGPGTYSAAHRVNDAGYAVGQSNTIDAGIHAVLWTPGGAIVDLGTNDTALDINLRGRIVGIANDPAGFAPRPLHWVRGVRAVLPTLGGAEGAIFGVNERDEAVGWAQTVQGEQRATIWFGTRPLQLDTLLDAASSGMVIDAAYAINDRGQIAATRRLANNRVEALLLTPQRCHRK